MIMSIDVIPSSLSFFLSFFLSFLSLSFFPDEIQQNKWTKLLESSNMKSYWKEHE